MKLTPFLFAILIACHASSQTLDLEVFASGFNRPVDIQNAGDDRLFIVEQDGVIRIANSDGSVNTVPFLDIDTRVGSSASEQGLLGLAFHPNYATNGLFYLYYTNNSGTSTIAEYSVSSNPDVADSTSERILLTFSQPFNNHNGGALAFSPIDGYLYIASGDGGSANDPGDRAQATTNLLGKILRIDVNSGTPYAIPSDNPFVGIAGEDEIWAYGLRNPWRISFDSQNGDLWIADVGQFVIEEIDRIPTSASGQPLNLGWRCYEGDLLNDDVDTTDCPAYAQTTPPVAQYSHNGDGLFKCSITGGYVYRGNDYPNLAGKYIFADYCSDELGIAAFDGFNWNLTFFGPFNNNGFSTFGVDQNNVLYVAGLDSGIVYMVRDSDLSNEGFEDPRFEVYPNPVRQVLNIRAKNIVASAITTHIFDITGRKHFSARSALDGSDIQLDVSTLTAGIYFLELNTENGITHNHKIIVN